MLTGVISTAGLTNSLKNKYLFAFQAVHRVTERRFNSLPTNGNKANS